jgi:uncharacterized protein YjbI with pentapeptide repeats
LKQGVEVWNRWIKDRRSRNLESTWYLDIHQRTMVDLTEADLMLHDLARIDFAGVDLSRVNLSGANLSLGDLSDANLTSADLHGRYDPRMRSLLGEKRTTFLHHTDFSRAILKNANLKYAQLDRANFTWADLSDADLTGASLDKTLFGYTNLRGTKGLEQCLFLGPNILDYGTLAKSGNLKDRFLQGCGLPQPFIESLQRLLVQAGPYLSCFISHSTTDREFAEHLYVDLQNAGVSCWFAPEHLKIGDPFRQRIDESIRLHDKLLLILSQGSVNSQWVQDEVEAALERERRENRLVVFPIRIDNAITDTDKAWAASIRRTRHIGDFSSPKDHDDYQHAFQRLLRDLKAQDGKEPT